MSDAGRVAVVIVNYRTPDLALRAVDSLAGERQAFSGLGVVIVDNGSADGSAERLAEGLAEPGRAGWTRLIATDTNGGFGWGNNQALLALMQDPAPPAYVHLLNPDALVTPGAVAALAETLDHYPDCAAVGSALLESDGAATGAAFRFPSVGREFLRGSRTSRLGELLGIQPTLVDPVMEQEVDWVTGASVMLRMSALGQVGLFDTGFFLYFEEVELMWRLRRAGWSVRHQPQSVVRHIGGAATGVGRAPPVGGKAAALPAYWYASRRRYFARTLGRTGAVAAGLAWLAGDLLFLGRRALGLARQRIATEREARDLLRHGLLPDRRDLQSGVASRTDRIGEPPVWMVRQPS